MTLGIDFRLYQDSIAIGKKVDSDHKPTEEEKKTIDETVKEMRN